LSHVADVVYVVLCLGFAIVVAFSFLFCVVDVMNVEQAKIAEAAGACAVMALERIPSEIRKHGGQHGNSNQQRSNQQDTAGRDRRTEQD
jgi:hypothetical protein